MDKGCGQNDVCWDITDPGSGGNPGKPGTTGGGKGGGGEKRKCFIRGVEAACYDPDWGYYMNGCYYRLATPQPPATDPAWAGHKPGDGAIYDATCVTAAGVQTNQGWLQNPPPGAGTGPTPAELAQQALAKMTLLGPDIGIAPKTGGKGVVGMPVWMWANDTPNHWGPVTASATAGAVTVNATAKVSKVVWSMGDGTTVTCTGAGTPYQAAFGKKTSPDCGHRYRAPSSTQPSGKFPVSATATWTIDWQGGGETGQLTEIRDSDVAITVVEVQVLN
ncbi:ATP/GTP-binding protein [Streptomyces sp. NPDC127084]|uniref:ATP/GTP-binding protein n=1 Tax=Streptomyces sp. NPDC127084 TaxID=3347133 RepID=UPI00365F39C1